MDTVQDAVLQVENILKPLAVGSLLQQQNELPKFNFFIPSYQRGYRWDNVQVTDLLDDLFEFISTKKTVQDKYCLQPIVVKQLADGRYEVLDGQQRLTTIFILLSRLRRNNSEIDLFSLSYETRPDSAIFLRNIDATVNEQNPDYYYMSQAYCTIDQWLQETKNKKANIATSLFDAIVESIEFIWYEIKTSIDAIDVFTRINIGKIPLTNAELVKAVFLSKNNLSLGFVATDIEEKDFNKILSLRQNAIALEWDQMEKALQDPKVWGFVYGGDAVYETRIDYLLDLRSKKSATEKNQYHSFKFFYDRVKNVRHDTVLLTNYASSNHSFIEEEWNKLKGIFDILLEWYHDKTYNHLIGFLINENLPIIDIIEDFKQNNRKRFLELVKLKIERLINCDDIAALRYGAREANKKIERVLLLHNIINSLNIDDHNVNFPFEKMKGKRWTLEHIFAQNSDDLKEEDFLIWLDDHLAFFKAKPDEEEVIPIIDAIEKLLSVKNKKIEKDDFQDCFLKVSAYILNVIQEVDRTDMDKQEGEEGLQNAEDEYDWINDDNSIANLALLDGSTNSAIKNSLFDIKRNIILERDKDGAFIPGETKKVFLKYYTITPGHLAYWTLKDRKAYVESIKSSLNYFN